MRDRHIPRLCGSCAAPMERQRDDCWRCGVEWSPAEPSRPKIRLVPAVRAAEVKARVSAGRWDDDGGSYAEPPARRVAGGARR